MAQDRIGGIVRALVGVPQERLAVVGKVVNGLNSAATHGDQFQVELSKFVLGWKPSEVPVAVTGNPDLARWESFYERLFGLKPNLSTLRIPEKPEGVWPVRLIVVHWLVERMGMCPAEGVQKVLKKCFPDWGWEYSNNLDMSTTDDRDPRNGTYAVWVRSFREADGEFAKLSAIDLKANNHTGITMLEYILLKADYYFEKGEHLDQLNDTLCTGSRFLNGYMPHSGWRDGRLHVGACLSSSRSSHLRSRRVWA